MVFISFIIIFVELLKCLLFFNWNNYFLVFLLQSLFSIFVIIRLQECNYVIGFAIKLTNEQLISTSIFFEIYIKII